MIELSDSVREKLNNPEIIKGMAEQILLNRGRIDYNFCLMPRDAPGVICFFEDLPNEKLHISGNFYFSSKFDNELMKNINVELMSPMHVFHEYFSKISSKDNLELGGLSINWNASPPVPDFRSLESYNQKFFVDKGKSHQNVFAYSAGWPLKNFEKGEWQEYLAQVYSSSLQLGDFWKAKDKGGFLL